MNIGALHPSVRPAELSLEQLSTSSVIDEQQKVAELARQFESVLLRQMLQDARRPMFDESSEGGSTMRAYDDMVTERLADTISLGGGLGVASSLQAQLLRQMPDSGERPATPGNAPQQ